MRLLAIIVVMFSLPVLSVAQTVPDKAMDESLADFVVGSMYSARGDCEQAIPFFRNSLSLHKSAVAFRELAECYYFQGNMEMAIDLLEESIRLFPDDSLNHVVMGNLYYDLYRAGMPSDQIARNAFTHLKMAWEMAADEESGARSVEMAIAVKDSDSAVTIFEQLPIEIRKHPQLLGFMIPVYMERKQYNHVQKAIRMLINSRVQNPAFLEQVANLAISRNFYPEALKLMQQRIELDPDTFTDWDRLMFVALAAEECQTVERIFMDHYAQMPTPLALYSLGNCKGRQQNYKESAELFGKALEQGKGAWTESVAVDILRDYIKVLVAGRMDVDALRVAESAVEQYPDNGDLISDLLFIQCLNGHLDAAASLLDRISAVPDSRFDTARFRDQLKNTPAYPAMYFRGMILYSLEDLKPAKRELEGAYNLVKDDIDVVVALAFIYDSEGKERDVVRIYRAALALYPENPLLLNNLSYSLLIYNRNLDEGLSMARRAVALEPESPVYRDTLGYGLLLKGALDEAYEHLSFAYEKRPEDGEICTHLGELYFKRGEFEKARELWLEAIENGGVDEEEIRTRIRFLDR